MNEKSPLQQFWLRCLLSLGLLWGILPLITLPFINGGPMDTPIDAWAAISNGLTILPASLLAFWHRRVACVWLTINAALVVSAMTSFALRNHEYHTGSIIGAGVSALLAVLLDVTEYRRWPGALGSGESGRESVSS